MPSYLLVLAALLVVGFFVSGSAEKILNSPDSGCIVIDEILGMFVTLAVTPPQQLQQQIPKPVTKRVPIPDPTPDEPEPIREETQREDIDFVPDDNLVIGVPDAPPPAEPEGPIRFVVGGNITEPVKLSGPNPIYPEAARRARIQGVVVLECIIAKDGSVREAKVLRGLPLGLTEAAVDAVKKWKFEPSTLNNKPVEVLYILTVRFNLQ